MCEPDHEHEVTRHWRSSRPLARAYAVICESESPRRNLMLVSVVLAGLAVGAQVRGGLGGRTGL